MKNSSKLQIRKLALLLLAIGCIASNSVASHLAGAGIKYESLGNNKYLIEVMAVSDCSGASFNQVTATISYLCLSGGSNIWQYAVLNHQPYLAPTPTKYGGPYSGIENIVSGTSLVSEEVSDLCNHVLDPKNGQNSACRGQFPFARNKAYIRIKYSGVVTLPPCALYRIGFSPNCCRNTSGSNVSSAGMYVHTLVNTASFPRNSSPEFFDEVKPVSNVCIGQQFSYAAGAHDHDGDSLSFKLTCAMSDTSNCVTYNTGYSAQQPLAGIAIDAETGLITGTPATTGVKAVAFWVEEYDRCTGVLKAKTQREIQFNSKTCINTAPRIIGGVSNIQGNASVDLNNRITVCAGETISWDETIADTNTIDSIHIKTNISDVLPGATYQIVNAGQKNRIIVRYTWRSVVLNSEYKNFTTRFTDDRCPNSTNEYVGSGARVTRLRILSAMDAGKDLYSCIGDTVSISAAGGTQFSWRSISGDPIVAGANWFPDTNTGFDTNKFVRFVPSQTTRLEVTGQALKDVCGNSINGCKSVDTLTVFATDSFTVLNVVDSVICNPATNQISVQTSQNHGPYSYQWSASQYLSSDTARAPRLLSLNDSQRFDVTVTSNGGCVEEGYVSVLMSQPFPTNMKLLDLDTNICLGDTVTLKLDKGQVDYGNCGTSTTQCFGVSATKELGSGSLLSDSIPTFGTMYDSRNKSSKHTFIYTVADLKSIGVEPGLINSLGFKVGWIPPANNTYKDFTIKIGCASSSSFQIPTQVVYYASQYKLVNGWNVHHFDSNYAWTGDSNLIVQVCFSVDSVDGVSPKIFYDYRSAFHRRWVNFNGKTACSDINLGTAYSVHPTTKIGFCSSVKNENFIFNWSQIPSSKASGFISPTNVDSVDLVVASSSARTYKVEVRDTAGKCYRELFQTINLIQKYNTTISPIPAICNPGAPVQLTAATPYSVATPGGKWSGAGIVDNKLGLWDRNKSGSGNFKVKYEITGNSCASADSISIDVLPKPIGGIQPLEFICGKHADIGKHELVGLSPNGIFSGFGVTSKTVGTTTKYYVDGTRFSPTLQIPDTVRVRHRVGSNCITDTIIKIPVIESWNYTYLGIRSNGANYYKRNFCANSGPDTLMVAGANPTWRILSSAYPKNRLAMLDSSKGIFDPRLINIDSTVGTAGSVLLQLEVKNDGFCGAREFISIRVHSSPEVKILSEDFCFNVAGICDSSNVPQSERTQKFRVRAAKYPSYKISDTDPSTYTDDITINQSNTGWRNVVTRNGSTGWDGGTWMPFKTKFEKEMCSLNPGVYPLSYQLGIGFREAVPGFPSTDSTICYSYFDTLVEVEQGVSANITSNGDFCNDEKVELEVSSSSNRVSYLWSTGEISTKITPNKKGTYTVKAFKSYCTSTATFTPGICAGVFEQTNLLNASLFPNPTSDILNLIVSDLKVNSLDLEIHSLSGQMLEHFYFENITGKIEAQINVSQFPAGIYLFKLDNTQEIATYRVVIK